MPKGVFGVSYWSSRRRFKGARDGPSSAALKRLNCPTVTLDATTCRVIAALSSSSLHPAINLRPPSMTVSSHAPRSSAAAFPVPANAKSPNVFCHTVGSFLFLLHRPALLRSLHPAKYDPVGQPTTVHTDERPRSLLPSRAHGGLNALTSGPLESFGVGQEAVVLHSAPGSKDSK